MGIALLIQSVPVAVDMSTLISLGTVVVMLGAAWRLSAQLARMDEKLVRLGGVPERLLLVEGHVKNLETDVSNLWAAYRGDDALRTRRELGPFAPQGRRDGVRDG